MGWYTMGVEVDPKGEEARAIHALADFAGAAVIEIGCGDGRLTWRYADRAASVLGLDVNEAKIAEATKATPDRLRGRVHFEVRDIVEDPVGDGEFDIAVLAPSL